MSNLILFRVEQRPKRLTNKKGFALFSTFDLRKLLIEQNDIVWYDWDNHAIQLTPESARKYSECFSKYPADTWFNRKFFVCVDGVEIYSGALGLLRPRDH